MVNKIIHRANVSFSLRHFELLLTLFSRNTDIKNVMISIAIASHSTFNFSTNNNHIKSLQNK